MSNYLLDMSSLIRVKDVYKAESGLNVNHYDINQVIGLFSCRYVYAI